MKSDMYDHQQQDMGEASESLWLPPPDTWLIDPNEDKIDTPVDERGLISVPHLIAAVKQTIDPSYEWGGQTSKHHLYWPEAQYPRWESPLHVGDPAAFRNLPINIARVPRIFENWLHKVTVPPESPPPEVMALQVEAWRVATALFKTARKSHAHEQLSHRRRQNIANGDVSLRDDFEGVDVIGEVYIQEQFRKYFQDWQMLTERNGQLPEDFRVHGIENARSAELAKPLGRLVGPDGCTSCQTLLLRANSHLPVNGETLAAAMIFYLFSWLLVVPVGTNQKQKTDRKWQT